jgi:hypothetical protein
MPLLFFDKCWYFIKYTRIRNDNKPHKDQRMIINSLNDTIGIRDISEDKQDIILIPKSS